MKFSNFVILSALTAQSSSFVVQSPIKRQYTDHGSKRVSGIVITHPRFDPVIHAVGDPSDVLGAASILSKLPILATPLVAIAAGLSALNQRDRIRDEIATTETELQAIRKRLESSQMMINTSFGATGISLLFAVVNVFGGAPTQPTPSSLPSTTLSSKDSPNQVVSGTKTKDIDLGAKPSERSLLPATEGGNKEPSTFDSLLQKLETVTEKIETTKSSETEGQKFETPIIGGMVEPKVPSLNIPQKIAALMDSKKEDTQEELKLETPKVNESKAAPAKTATAKVEIPPQEDSSDTVTQKMTESKKEELKSEMLKVEEPYTKATTAKNNIPVQEEKTTELKKEETEANKIAESKISSLKNEKSTEESAIESTKEEGVKSDVFKDAGKAIEEKIPFFGVKEETPKMDLLKLDPVKELVKEPAKESENEVVPMKTESIKDPLEEIKQIAVPLKIGGTSENEDTQLSIAKTMVNLFDRASVPSLVPSGDAPSQDAEIDIASIIGVGGIVAAGAIAVFGAITFVGESDPSSDNKNERKQSTMKTDTGVSTKTDTTRATNLVEKVAEQRPTISVKSEKDASQFSFAKESTKDSKKVDSRSYLNEKENQTTELFPQKTSIQNQLDGNTMSSTAPAPAPAPAPSSTLSYLETVTTSVPPERKASFKAAYNPRTANNSPATVGASNSYLESMNASSPPKVKAPFKAMYNPKAAANQQEGNKFPAVSTSYLENVGSSPSVTENISKGFTSGGPEVVGTSKSYLESMNASGPPKVKAPFKAMYNPRAAANQQEGNKFPAVSTSYLENAGSSPSVTENISKGFTLGGPEVAGTSKSYLESMNASGPPKVKAPFKAMYNPRAVVNEPERNKMPEMPKTFLETMESFPPITGSARNDIGSSNSYLEGMNASGPPKVKAPYKAMYNPRTAANVNAESSSTGTESLNNDYASARPEFSDSPKAPIGTGSYLDNL